MRRSKPFLKKIRSSKVVNLIIANIIYIFIRLLKLTYKFNYTSIHLLEKAKNSNQYNSYILALWHQHLISGIFAHLNTSYIVMVSPSNDGDLVATTLKRVGHIPVRGSSSRNGKKAMHEMIQLVQKSYPAALSVDGPRGPANIVKSGVVEIARVCEIPIVPVIIHPKSCWTFNKSWDKFKLPKPFSQIDITHGEPIHIAKDISKNDFDKIKIEIKAILDS